MEIPAALAPNKIVSLLSVIAWLFTVFFKIFKIFYTKKMDEILSLGMNYEVLTGISTRP